VAVGGEAPGTPAQVKRIFAAEGIRLVLNPYGTSREDKLTAFESANEDDDLSVAVATDNATAKKNASDLAALFGAPGGHPDIVRVGNVIVVYGRNTSPKTKAGARAGHRAHPRVAQGSFRSTGPLRRARPASTIRR
jgi:hypothetical protein